ncbi:MAG: cyclic nucleotide-binding domain-containing protein [Limnohabitans sp.]|jgi:CRP-like cAMP-binding protein
MALPSRQFAAGDVLFSRGDPASTLYTIEKGDVDLFVPPGRTFLVRLGPGACLGEQALIAGGVRNATAVAVSEVVCTELTAQALQESVLGETTLVRPVLEALLMQLSLVNAVHSVMPELFVESGWSHTLESFQVDRVSQSK